MGIYGLTSYIANHASDCFVDHKLHDCVVLVDGNSAASLIYSILTKSNHAFGGDYDKYAHSTGEFVKLLLKCDVRPIFIFDGGYESRKVKTIIERIKLNIVICGQYKHKYREGRSFPLLLRDVFKMVLHELNVPVVQCDFEADHEIVTLARILKCPVISSDSDFYVSDVRYIPFTSIEFRTVRFKKKTNVRRYYVPCKMFDDDKFFKQFGGLDDKSNLPLLSCALGNDYVPTNVFKNFLDMNHATKFDDRIRKIVKWLRTVTSADRAIQQMASTLTRKHHSLQTSIHQLVSEFQRTHSVLLPHLPPELLVDRTVEEDLSKLTLSDVEPAEKSEDCLLPATDDDIAQDQSVIELSTVSYDDNVDETIYAKDDDDDDDDDGVIELEEEEFEISYSDSGSISEPDTEDFVEMPTRTFEPGSRSVNSSIKFDSQAEYSEAHIDLEIPAWLSEKFRRGLVSPTVMNVLNFQRIFILSQSEDYFCRPSHEICLPVLQLCVGIILGEQTNVQCHARHKNMQIGVYNIVPILEIPSYGPLPNLKSVASLDLESRMRVILEGLQIPKNVVLERFPEEWRLYVITLLYWKKNCAQCTINSSHIRALFVCLIYLSVVDKKIGFTRGNNDLRILRKASKRQENDTEDKNTAEQSDDVSSTQFSFRDVNRSDEYLSQVSESDCFRAANVLMHYHRVEENLLKNRKQFDKKTVHAFAQLQHCVHSITLLNSVLDFPFAQYQPHRLFSGTFVYNFYLELHARKLADGYITRTLLAKANSLIALYRYLIGSWEVCISLKETRLEGRKKKSKRKKRKVGDKSVGTNEGAGDDVDTDEGYDDPDNIFSILPEE